MPMNKGKDTGRRALIVEDDEGVRRSLQLLLHWRGYDARSYAAADLLLASDDINGADVLIADYRLPDATGFDVLLALQQRGWTGRSVLITAFPSDELVATAKKIGFDAILEKPLRQQELAIALAAERPPYNPECRRNDDRSSKGSKLVRLERDHEERSSSRT